MPDNIGPTSQSTNEEMANIIGPELNIPSTVVAKDSLSVAEADFITMLGRREKALLSWVFITFLLFAGAAFIYAATARILHFALPLDKSCTIFWGFIPFHSWLDKEQIQEIDKILFSGSIGAILATFAKGKLGR